MDNRCAGRVEVQKNQEWMPLSLRHSWSLKEAAVVCRQLGCGAVVSTKRVDHPGTRQPSWHFYSNCDGSERVLLGCGTVEKWSSASATEVVCSDILPKPVITFYSGINEKEVPVNRTRKGYSFTLSCYIEPRYGGGNFTLVLTGLMGNHSWTQPAFSHSAIFTFKAANEMHEGNYRCLYHHRVFNHNFTTESGNLSVTVDTFPDVRLDDGVARDDDSYTACSGKLLINHLGERPLSAESKVWDLKHALLVCRQLGCGSAVSTQTVKLPKAEPVFLLYSDCDESDSVLLDCAAVRPWESSLVVEVTCTGHSGPADRT
ncbi:scavenger receptor cysteine-rich type 1 protein M130-like [Pholidichthys leucotaenia]